MTDLSAVEAVFSAAVAHTDPAARAAYLDRACRADPALRGQVERLLAAHPGLGHFLDPPTPPAVATPTVGYEPAGAGAVDLPGTVLGGRYKLLEVIGEGGMGTVWMAQQAEPVRRVVAVKLVKAGLDSAAVLARFEAERQALALMDHPNIARVYDGGATDAGRPYFVMELVKGVPVTAYCDARKLPPRDRLALFADICRAVQHAHTKGVIHRDLKPSNVLVALYDEKPVPKVIDFGIAKAAGQPLTDKTLVTGFGAVVGTPEYMSPEQATLNQLDIDTRSDVYSLGVLLYELLAGSPPFPRDELGRVGLLEVLRVVREVDPPKPSARLSTAAGAAALAADRGVKPKELAAQVRGELDWVVMKALEKDRSRRYETAAGLAADVERYLAGDAVAAAPPSVVYRLRKVARRNTAALVAGLAVVMALAVGAGVATWQAVRATRAEGRAEARYAVARQVVDDMYTQVAEKWLAQQGELTQVQREFLEKALVFYNQAADERPGDEAALIDAVRARARVARIHRKLGQYPESVAAFRQLIELFEPVATRNPDRLDYLRDLARMHFDLGSSLAEGGHPKPAVIALSRSVTLHQNLADRTPDDLRNLGLVAGAWRGLGVTYLQSGRMADAERAYTRGRDLFSRLAVELPDGLYGGSGYGVLVADCEHGLGIVYSETGRLPEAEQAYRRAESAYEGVLAASPPTDGARAGLAKTLATLASLQGRTGREAEGDETYQRSIELHEALAAKNPNDQRTLGLLALTEFERLVFLVGTGRDQEAVRAADRAADRAGRAVATLPPSGVHRQHYVALFAIAADLYSVPGGGRSPDPPKALALADRAAALADGAGEQAWQSLGWARYRAGDWPGSLEALRKQREQRGYESDGDFVGAMALWRLGDRDAARATFNRHDRWFVGYERRWKAGGYPPPAMLRRLRAEAAALLGLSPPDGAGREVAPAPRPVNR
ncbi:MAG TPA: serine/threonine-protein kinase [Urbifossiella sp.]|nr:serine/threonine-protein kinase [Urbifossiella sp.]